MIEWFQIYQEKSVIFGQCLDRYKSSCVIEWVQIYQEKSVIFVQCLDRCKSSSV